MLEKSGSGNLAPEPLDVLFGSKLPRQNHLQRNNPFELEMPRAVDYAHATTGNFLEKFIIAEESSRTAFPDRRRSLAFSQRLSLAGAKARGLLRRPFQAAFQQATNAQPRRLVRT